jgi:hypothetical protein
VGQKFPHPQKGPDHTYLASSTVDIRPVPRRLKGPGCGIGHLCLTSGAKLGIQLPRLKKDLEWNFFLYIYFILEKSKRMRWVWHEARMDVGEVHTGFWYVNLREIDLLIKCN